ncbi:hypothetical protein ACF3DV_20195 [Chlorogloeopsis fritschii PCC 9212]|uniref:Uncharacterized protein n=1 Tax=Chlorogloeopsis fritschii PCC 6912 TaxID=211165 RepID=A0A3S0YHG5_CHLFR|nr:hypothetical protein [Chlorogloeopsis fritschii]RUR84623.1 hypothetical protein PCC6912_15180 [Chlorogloeopsis fritschii PCC 6912]
MVRLLQKQQRTVSLLTTFAIATFGLHALALFFLIFQGLTIRQLSLRKPPAFVQLVDGQPVAAVDDTERDPETIRQFVSKTITSMFNWSGTLPPQNIEEATKPKPDLGILIKTPQGNSQRVTTSSWIASFALSEDFRKGFLSEIAAMTPPEVFARNPKQAMSAQINIKRVYPPEKIADGKWRVGIVADLIQQKRADNRKVIVPFNKDLLVRAVDYFAYPLDSNSSVLQKAIYGVRTERLEIYEMRNLCLLDEYNNLSSEQLQRCGNNQSTENFTR